MKAPCLNDIYEKNGEFRQVVQLRKNQRDILPDVVFLVLNQGKKRSIWLPFWHEWVKGARLVAGEAIPTKGVPQVQDSFDLSSAAGSFSVCSAG